MRGKTPLTFAFLKTVKVEFLAIGTGRNLRIFRRESAPISFWPCQETLGEVSLRQRHLPQAPTRNVGAFRFRPHTP